MPWTLFQVLHFKHNIFKASLPTHWSLPTFLFPCNWQDFYCIPGHIGVQCTHRRNRRTPQGTTEKLARQVAKTGAQKATATRRIQNTRRTTGPAQTDICVLILKVCFSKTIHKTYQFCNLLLLYYFYYIFFFLWKDKTILYVFINNVPMYNKFSFLLEN